MEFESMAGFSIQQDSGRVLLHFSKGRSAISLQKELPEERQESPCQLSNSRG